MERNKKLDKELKQLRMKKRADFSDGGIIWIFILIGILVISLIFFSKAVILNSEKEYFKEMNYKYGCGYGNRPSCDYSSYGTSNYYEESYKPNILNKKETKIFRESIVVNTNLPLKKYVISSIFYHSFLI